MKPGPAPRFVGGPILPPDPTDLEPLHDREYRVRAYRRADDALLIRASLRDQQPGGLYFEDDPEPILVHHMVVEIDIDFPSLDITRIQTVFESHPHSTCPAIAEAYTRLVGVSFREHFNSRLRELMGGPAGCVHVTALLQAVRPVVMQYAWPLGVSIARRADRPIEQVIMPARTPSAWRRNYDTCHVWASDGALVASIEHDGSVPVPDPLLRRFGERAQLGGPGSRETGEAASP